MPRLRPAAFPPLHPSLRRWLRNSPSTMTAFEPPEDEAAWPAVARDAAQHGLIPLLYAHLPSACGMPEAIRDAWRAQAAQVAARNLLLAAELAQILRAACARGITCVPVRGVGLAEELYGHPALRPTGDIDVLVRRSELGAVRAVLAEQGFAEVEARRGFAEAFDYTLTFLKYRGLVVAEPHWTIGYPPFGDRFDMAAVWARCRSGTAAGVPAMLLGPEDLLLHLCLHLIHHREAAPLLWRYELCRYLHTHAVDWMLVCTTAREGHVGPLVAAALRDVQRLFDAPIPTTALSALDQAGLSRSERVLVSLLTTPRPVKGRERLAAFLGLRGWLLKLRYALAFLFPSRDFIRRQYGVTTPWQIIRTYVSRVWELAWRGTQGLCGLCLRSFGM